MNDTDFLIRSFGGESPLFHELAGVGRADSGFTFVMTRSEDYSIPRWVGATGVAVLVLGNWVFWKSHKDLGGNWSPTLDIRQDHKLVTQGIYQRIRHPMYLSLWLLVIAQAMILPNYVAGFAGLVPFGFLYFQRVAREERMMVEEFGSDYERYAAKTGRLFPKL
jgi:protein-S-isoprenylcysteine O-methyltransferase Ste14